MEPLTKERLLAIRSGLGLTQEKLAQILGCSWVSVSRWEKGHSTPLPGLADIYRALGDALTAGAAPSGIVQAAQGDRGTFLHKLFTMAYGAKGRTR